MRNVSPDELRTAQIQRQHSQEMAVRYLAANKSKASDKITLEVVEATTDWFENDINNAVRLRDVSIEQTSNGDVPVASEEVLSLDDAILLVEKIKGTPDAMHPMIKNKMTSMGVKGVRSVEDAVKQLTPAKATELEDYIDSQVDGG